MLAIVIPYYKMRFFRETLESLAAQTDQRFKVYIGDDASPESPFSLLEEFRGKFHFQYKRFGENLGGKFLTKQWERCLNMLSDEEWFMILGDDDFLSPTAIKGFYQTVNSLPNGISVMRYNFKVLHKNGGVSPEIQYSDMESSTLFITNLCRGKVRSSLSEYIFKVKSYLELGIKEYDKAFFSDNWMVLNYSNFGSIKNVEAGYVCIRISEDSITGNAANTEVLRDAGYNFYTDLLVECNNFFTESERLNFLYILFDGYILKKTRSSLFFVFRTIYRNSNIKITLRFGQLYLKTIGMRILRKKSNSMYS